MTSMTFLEFWLIDWALTVRIAHLPKGSTERNCLYEIRHALGVFFDTQE